MKGFKCKYFILRWCWGKASNASYFFGKWSQETPVGHCGRETVKGRQQVKGASARKLTLWAPESQSLGDRKHAFTSPYSGLLLRALFLHNVLLVLLGWDPGTEVGAFHSCWCEERNMVWTIRVVQWLQDTYTHTLTHIYTCTQLHKQSHMHTHCLHIDTYKHSDMYPHVLAFTCTLLYTCAHTCAKHITLMHVPMHTITCIQSHTHHHPVTPRHTHSPTHSHRVTHTLMETECLRACCHWIL